MEDDKFYSSSLKKLYNKFKSMFEQEGDVYHSILETINDDFKSGEISESVQKKTIISVLDEAAVEYYFQEKITIHNEKSFFDEILQ